MKSRAQMYDELLRQSKARRDENILDHKARTARIRKGKTRQARLNPRATAAKTPLDFLAIGDSSFEYPLYDNGPIWEELSVPPALTLVVLSALNAFVAPARTCPAGVRNPSPKRKSERRPFALSVDKQRDAASRFGADRTHSLGLWAPAAFAEKIRQRLQRGPDLPSARIVEKHPVERQRRQIVEDGDKAPRGEVRSHVVERRLKQPHALIAARTANLPSLTASRRSA